MKDLFGESKVRDSLGLGRDCSLEAHSIPEVGKMFGPSLSSGASWRICHG